MSVLAGRRQQKPLHSVKFVALVAEEGTLSGSFLASLAETYEYLPFYISSIILKYGR